MDMAPSAPTRKPTASRAARPAFYALCALACISLASCDWIRSLFPESFGPEYSDTTTNFIAAHALAQPPLASDQGATVALGTPAIWDWAWRGKTGNSFQYMTLTDAGTVGSAATSGTYTLAAEAPAWRLELVNLAVNSNFKLGSQAEWSPSGSANIIISNLASISGYSMFLSVSNSDYDYITMSATAFYLDPNPANHQYQLSCNVSNSSVLRYVSTDKAYKFADAQNPQWAGTARFTFPSRFSDVYLTTTGGTATIDDFHAIRSDIPSDLAIRLRLRSEDTSPTLAPGLYEFAVWVKKPVNCYYPTEDGRGDSNDYASSAVTIKLVRIGTAESTLGTASFSIPENGNNWNRIYVRMTTPLNFTEGVDTEAIMEIRIIPTDTVLSSAGEILLAAPSLHFYKNDY